MSFHELGNAIKKTIRWLGENQIRYALVGGLAVSFRTTERATKDIDLAIASTNTFETEEIIRAFQSLGFKPTMLLENKLHNRISTVRLLSDEFPGIYLDLLFAASGIEPEIVQTAEVVEILPELEVRVASLPSLIAMKVLSGTNRHRKQDLLDLDNLIGDAADEDLVEAERLIKTIEERGYHQSKNLSELFQSLLKESRD